jgi:catechol 2,3-dioxygenase-like lactoylglutathione lyase family enzyme
MELGAFSISLAVRDLEASRRFYEKFGFKVFAGDAAQNWLILRTAITLRPRETLGSTRRGGLGYTMAWPISR